MRFAHSSGLTCSRTDFCFLIRVTLMTCSSCVSPMPRSLTPTARPRAYPFARWHRSRTGATLKVRKRPIPVIQANPGYGSYLPVLEHATIMNYPVRITGLAAGVLLQFWVFGPILPGTVVPSDRRFGDPRGG